MTIIQTIILGIFSFVSLVLFFMGLNQTNKSRVFTETPFLGWMGIFVWGDAIVFAPFWFFVSLISFFLRDFILFMLVVSAFWFVRGLGEMIYWLNQQFSSIKRNPPEKLHGNKLFRGEGVWFLYQINWQVIMVVSMIGMIYFGSLWIKNLPSPF